LGERPGETERLGAEGPLVDGDRPLEERRGLGGTPGIAVERGQLGERVGEIDVLGAEGALDDGDCLLAERLGLGEPTDDAVEAG
jgi:hypothetical protein